MFDNMNGKREGAFNNLFLSNYPNPGNPNTSISFVLKEQSYITLKIYNILGQEISTIAESGFMEAGRQMIEINSENLASGVYYYRIFIRTEEGDEYFTTNKMILMK